MDTSREYKTRSGMTARFICKDDANPAFPYIYAIETYDGKESLERFSEAGKCWSARTLLRLVETTDPCIRYVNIYDPHDYYQTDEDAARHYRTGAINRKTIKMTFTKGKLTDCEVVR